MQESALGRLDFEALASSLPADVNADAAAGEGEVNADPATPQTQPLSFDEPALSPAPQEEHEQAPAPDTTP